MCSSLIFNLLNDFKSQETTAVRTARTDICLKIKIKTYSNVIQLICLNENVIVKTLKSNFAFS